MTSEKEPLMYPEQSRAFPIKPPPRGIDLPDSDGEPMDSQRHFDQMTLLIHSLNLAWKDRDDFYAGGDMFVYYSELQSKRNDFRGPDVFVVLNTHRFPDRRSWVVWEEDGQLPELIIELISPSTEAEDRGKKMDLYSRVLRVPNYFIFDPFSLRLDGYQLDLSTRSYRPIDKDDQGRFRVTSIGLGLGLVRSKWNGYEGDWLRWLDSEGRPLLHAEESAEVEAQRAEEEARLRQAEAQRADEQTRRADEQTRRADEQTRRADEQTRRADEEARRAAGALAELTELKRLLGKDAP